MKKLYFFDTNIVIRYLTNDDEKKAQKCLELFRKAERKEILLTTSESVIAEIVYILSSRSLYNLSREEVRKRLYPILNLKGLKLKNKNTYMEALDVYVSKKIDFEDALTFSLMKKEGIEDIYSYDRDFNKFSEITRKEP